MATTYAQNSSFFDYTESFDYVFRNVSRTDATTGILYERVVPFSSLYNFNSNMYPYVDTSNAEHFLLSYHHLYKASFQPVNSLPFDYETIQSFFTRGSDTVDIGILHYKFNILDSAIAYQKLYFDSDSILHENSAISASLYAERTAFLAAPLKELINIGTTTFRFRNLFQFDNTQNQIVELWADFDDGIGIRQITDTLTTVTYSIAGIKIIEMEAVFNNGDTLVAYSKLNCSSPPSKGVPGSQSNHPHIGAIETITAKITPNNPYDGGTFAKAKGNVCIYYKDSTKTLRKPILIVDGFDPTNVRSFESHENDGKSLWEMLGNGLSASQNLGKQLLEKGYDLVILDPQDGGAYIEQNAMVCIEVINEINRRLLQSGSQEEIVIVGPSMGGQITRYALAYMEKNPNTNTNFGKHNCRLWISFDSPHQGANISIGAQALVDYFSKETGNGTVAKLWNNLICSKPAKQMLLIHKASGAPTIHNKYYNTSLYNIGYPENLRKIAISNGSLNNTANGVAHQIAFEGVLWWTYVVIPYIMDIRIRNVVNSGTGEVFSATHWIFFIPIHIKWSHTNNTGKCSLDVAPGASYNTFDQIGAAVKKLGVTVQTNQHTHCFMPITSVLDISGNMNYCTNFSSINLVAQGKTPFQSYWGPTNKNMEHISFDNNLATWLINEIETYTTGSRTISICDNATVPYTVHLPAGKNSTVTWAHSSNLQIISGQGTKTIQVKPIGLGEAWVQATLTGTVLTHNQTLKKYTIEVGSGMAHNIAPATITQNTTWNTPYTANNLIIQSGATLTIKSTAYFVPSASITILPGGKLVVDGGKLTNACEGQLWQGIIVDGNTNLPQTAQNQGTLEIKNGAVIENANKSISTHGGIIQAENATFKNNRKSVEFLAYSGGGITPIPQNVSYFKKCTFVLNTNNQFTSNPLPHITMWAVNGVKINGCTFTNSLPNMYDDRRAIVTANAGYIVDDNCSHFSTGQCACTGTSTPTVFQGFKKAIEAVNSTNQYNIKIERSNFSNNITAIELSGISNFRITESNLALNATYNNSPVGIRLDNCTSYKIEGNTIHNTNATKSRGVFISNAGTNENKIYRNDIVNTQYGIQVGTSCIHQPQEPFTNELEEAANTLRSFPFSGLQFLCNDLQNNNYDIYVCNNGVIRQSQGATTKGADNRFSTNPTFNFYCEKTSFPVSYYYDFNNSFKTPSRITNNITLYNATANSCGNMLCFDEAVISPEGLSGKGGGKSLNITTADSDLEKYHEINLYFSEMMSYFYAMGYDKILNNYYEGKIENEELLQQAIAYHEELLQITDYLAELSDRNLYQLKTDSLIDLSQIRDWYDEIYTLSAKYSLAETYYQLEKYEEGFNTLALIPEMYNLNEVEMIEYNNYVSLFTFKNTIRESGRNVTQLNEAEIEQLIQFAKVSHGLSSTLAKGTLCFFYDICLEDEDAEGGKQKAEGDEMMMYPPLAGELKGVENDEMMNQSAGEKLLENITVVPNPTTGQLKIESGELKIESVEVYDVYGKRQKAEDRKDNVLDISNLSAGLYFVKIKTSVGEVVKKVVKQ